MNTLRKTYMHSFKIYFISVYFAVMSFLTNIHPLRIEFRYRLLTEQFLLKAGNVAFSRRSILIFMSR